MPTIATPRTMILSEPLSAGAFTVEARRPFLVSTRFDVEIAAALRPW